MQLAFVVLGPPKPWQRAAPGVRGRAHKPKASRDYQRLVGTIAGLQRPPGWPLDALYEVTFVAYFPDARVRDKDNVTKNVFDGLKKVLFKDDNQVVSGDQGVEIDRDRPRLEVLVRVLTRDDAEQANRRRARAIEVVREQAASLARAHRAPA